MSKWCMLTRLKESAYDKGNATERMAFKVGYADGFSKRDKATNAVGGESFVVFGELLRAVYDLGYANGELDRG